MLIAALLPPLQAIESIAAAPLILRGRYDLRGLWLTLSMGLRLAGIAVGAQHGVTGAVIGVVVAQVLTTRLDPRRRLRRACGASRARRPCRSGTTAGRSRASCSRAPPTPG